jgi:hypothetical protein
MSIASKTAFAIVRDKAAVNGVGERTAALTQAAQTYRDNHHWVPLRLEGKSPDCMGKGWTKRTLANAIPKFQQGDNIGILLGAPSGDMVRLDPDFPSIPSVTEILFPEPTLLSGRKSSPLSGRFYICKGLKSRDFQLPSKGMEEDPRLPLHNGEPGLTVFQLLSTGKQHMAPPSIHPESGEEIVWENDTPLATLDAKELLRRVGIEAFLLTVRQFWPARGKRNEAAWSLARVLLEAFATRYANDEERIAVVDALVLAVAMAGGDGEASRKGKERADATLAKMKAGEETTGLTRLVELLELPPYVGKTLRKWLGLSSQLHAAVAGGVLLEDFNAYMPQHNYIFMPSREPWPASSVNARLGNILLFDPHGRPVLDDKGEQIEMAASTWLDRNRPVEQMTWAPGLPMLIRDRLISDGGWIEWFKVTCLNLYRPPTIKPGNATEANQWLDHIHKVYGDDDKHIVQFLGHRVQKPQDKVNHALVLGGAQGIGKDTLLEPVKHAVGPWNFSEVSPHHMLGRFNGFLKSVILRVSEARDLGDVNRYQFYDHMKSYTAAPPDVLRVDEKHLREHSILNCCGVIITTNHKADGIFLPADDRRHFVAWSDRTKENFDTDYWNKLWTWYATGGINHVAAYLAQLDLSTFDAKAPPPKTQAFWDIVDANRAPEDAELADVLEKLKNPNAVTIAMISEAIEQHILIGDIRVGSDFFNWINDRKNRRAIPHRFEQCGYVPVRNDAATDGYFVIGGKRQAVYAKATLSISERLKAAGELANRKRSK